MHTHTNVWNLKLFDRIGSPLDDAIKTRALCVCAQKKMEQQKFNVSMLNLSSHVSIINMETFSIYLILAPVPIDLDGCCHDKRIKKKKKTATAELPSKFTSKPHIEKYEKL